MNDSGARMDAGMELIERAKQARDTAFAEAFAIADTKQERARFRSCIERGTMAGEAVTAARTICRYTTELRSTLTPQEQQEACDALAALTVSDVMPDRVTLTRLRDLGLFGEQS